MIDTANFSMNTSPDTRASLIVRLKASEDSSVWHEFVSIYESVIYRTARKQGLCHDDSAEVTQEVLTRVTKAIDGWEINPGRGSFRGWLYRITKNLSIDYLRKSKRRPTTGNDTTILNSIKAPGESGNDFDRQFERQVFRQTARTIENQFKPKTWKAFWMTTVDGKSIDEAVKQLDMTRGAIYIARSRVMAKLKQEVQKSLNETLGNLV